MRLAVVICLAVCAAPAPAQAQADYRFTGHGYGHGVGLAQYGAAGYARQESRSFRWILGHYYPGTRVAPGPAPRMRVRLKALSALRVSSADLITTAGRRVALRPGRTYRFSPWGDGLQAAELGTGHVLGRFTGPLRLSPAAAPLRLYGLAENGVRDGRYRGALLLSRLGAEVMAVDDVALEDYLRGVVGAEMPASWPREALRSQAVAARSFAVCTRRPDAPFDVYADTRSQVYRGVAAEAPAAVAAVAATRGLVVMAGAGVASTFFHASSGGRTAAVQDAFPGSPPLPYLVSVDDPYDRQSPHHDWTVTLSSVEIARRLGTAVPGELRGLSVVAVTASGRAATVRVTGTHGVRDLDAATARTLLGLRSTWFAIAPPAQDP